MNTSDEDGSREIYDAMREHTRAKKARNRKESTAELTRNGIAFTSANNGAHLMIRQGKRCWDLWPTTLRWRERMNEAGEGSFLMTNQSRRAGVGMESLLIQIGQAQ